MFNRITWRTAARWAGGIFRAATSGLTNPAKWLVDWVRGRESDSGISVDGKSALEYAPVWYAVNRIAGHLAQMPCRLIRTRNNKRETQSRHAGHRLIHKRPNPLMTPSVFKELIQYHALMWGNGRAFIERNQRGDPTALIPMLPDRTETILVGNEEHGLEKWHLTKAMIDGRYQERKFRDRDVLHIVGLGFDGLCGYPLWELGNNSFGLGLATEKHGNRFFKNNAQLSVLLEVPEGKLNKEEDAKEFLQRFRSAHEGGDKAFTAAMLRDGITAKQMGQSGQESQWIEQRKFQRQEVALWFLLEAITGDDSSVSYNSLEQKHLAYLTNCLGRWLVKWQEELESKLLKKAERESDEYAFRFNPGAILRADMKTTYQTLTMGVRGMLITVNEAREVLDLDPREGGDELMNPAITPGRGGGDGGAAAAA